MSNCGSQDTSSNKPSNLQVNIDVSSDGSGLVAMSASADNADYFLIYFGEVANETPFKSSVGMAEHYYAQSGSYTVKVSAYSSDGDFIDETNNIDVEIFFHIPETGYETPDHYDGMTLLWADEFDGTEINEDDWNFELGDGCPDVCGWGNNELEYYKKENTSLQDGYLIIEARKENAGGKLYTSSRITTQNKHSFTYGRVDVRAVLPKGQGIWPAIWMLGSNITNVGWPACGEVDIMELIGGGEGKDDMVHGTAHWDHSGQYANYGQGYQLPTGIFANEFHVFSITWDESFVTWYMDDIEFNKIDITPTELSEFQDDFFLIMNVAVGGNWPGSPNSSTIFPQHMIVDYVRVFQND